MQTIDIRWQQRFDNYQKALKQLGVFLKKENLNDLEKQGLIQSFEYTHELAWKTMADFLKSKGNIEIYGSKDAVREAFNKGLLESGDIWMEMIKSRNMTSHTYDEEVTKEIVVAIKSNYYNCFVEFEKKLKELNAIRS